MSNNDIPALRRRLLILRLGAAAPGLALAGTAVAAPKGAAPDTGATPAQYRTGITDNDPSDGPGQGRGQRRGTGITDSDPSDGPGKGRGTPRMG